MPITLPLPRFPAARPQTYDLLKGADLADTATVGAIFDDLETRLAQVGQENGPTMVEWLDLYDQFVEARAEEGEIRYDEYNSDLKNEAFEEAYNTWNGEATKQYNDRSFLLLQKLQQNPAFQALPPYYEEFRKGINTTMRLYSEENSTLRSEDQNLAGPFAALLSEQVIELDGQPVTSTDVKHILEGNDRAKREQAWVQDRGFLLPHQDFLNDMLGKQVALRLQQAKNAGFVLKDRPETGDFLHYAYADRKRSSTPEQTFALHQAAEDYLVPFMRELQRDRLERLIASGQIPKGGTLRPWDLTADPDGKPPLRPFKNREEYLEKVLAFGNAIDPRLAAPVAAAARDGLFDYEDRLGKASYYGFCSSWPQSQRQFINVNNALSQEGLGTLVHEGFGHGAHAYYRRGQNLAAYRADTNMEVAELAAMSQELIAPNHLDVFYDDPAERLRAERRMYEEFCNYLVAQIAYDAFEHWNYVNPAATRPEREEAWAGIAKRFDGIVDYSGQEALQPVRWQTRAMITDTPLYTEYVQAGLGALQISANYDRDPQKAMDAYIHFLKLGGSVSAPEAYAAAGIRFDGTGETLPASVDAMWKKLEILRGKEAALGLEASRKELGALEQSRRTAAIPEPSLSTEKTPTKV